MKHLNSQHFMLIFWSCFNRLVLKIKIVKSKGIFHFANSGEKSMQKLWIRQVDAEFSRKKKKRTKGLSFRPEYHLLPLQGSLVPFPVLFIRGSVFAVSQLLLYKILRKANTIVKLMNDVTLPSKLFVLFSQLFSVFWPFQSEASTWMMTISP